MQPKYAYPLGCHTGHVDKDAAGRRAVTEKDVWTLNVPSSRSHVLSYLARAGENLFKNIKRLNEVQLAT